MKVIAFALTIGVMFGAAVAKETPMSRVVSLLTSLKAKVEGDGMAEQKSYDKYACWCENTLARKAADINQGKEDIERLQRLIFKLNGELGAHGAEIEQLKKDIAANIDAQREAAEVRAKENNEYDGERTESEQCIGALEAAVKVLSGAGTGKKGFLQTLQEAQLLSVVAGIRGVLSRPTVSSTVSSKDIEVVKRFVERPEDFVSAPAAALGAVQIANNPFGEYAPQSTQISGILKGMYDAFTGDLEKSNVEEADKQKGFEAFMATKKQELETLEFTLQTQEKSHADKTKELADSETSQAETAKQVEADEAFFAETKAGCKVTSTEWAGRSRLRTQELQGIAKAIEILSSPKAQQTFMKSTTTFLQVSARNSMPNKAYGRLRTLAAKYQSVSLAMLAVQAKTGGHFDKVIVQIDAMVVTLRKEEQADIEHRDRCQNQQNANGNEMGDLDSDIKKKEGEIERMGNTAAGLEAKIATLEDDIKATEGSMAEMLANRNQESADFKQALKDDADAVALVEEAIVALASFFKDNKIPLELAQKQDPEYTVDEDKAPEKLWGVQGAKYGGAKSESGGIVAIMSMIVEDIQNEMKTSRDEEAEAQARYAKESAAQKATLDAQNDSKLTAEKELADVNGEKQDTEEAKSEKEGDLSAQQELEGALQHDCDWVEANFDSRRDKRKAEIAGLVDAKNFLAGVEAGTDELELP